MPFKRNPIKSEKIDSLGRYLAQLPAALWANASHSLLERTLDDSANRREILPSAFLCTDEMLKTAISIIGGLQLRDAARKKNLGTYGVFAATERLLMELGRRGADRQQMHEIIREHSLTAWDALQAGREHQLAKELSEDTRIQGYINTSEVLSLLDASSYVGDAPQRALAIAKVISSTLS